MEQAQGVAMGLLKKILFRPLTKSAGLQRLWGRLHTLAIFGMNYGGGGLIESSGEEWVLAHVVREACVTEDSPVVFDVGANVGHYTQLVLRHVPHARVYAVEPSRVAYDELRRNVGGDERVKTFRLGLSDTDRTVALHSYTADGQETTLLSSIDPRLPTQVVRVETSAVEEIEVQTLDHLCESEHVERIDFLKLDVEGHEPAILRGARRMLEEGRVSLIQFEFGPANIYSRTYFYDFWTLLSARYDIFRIIPKGIVRVPSYGEHHEVFLTTNYLAVLRRDPVAEARA
ncbi:MAG TPA: FkbM family methyltransferase [Pyrinomonadaceae bacterium]|nr:FkbM family methyltransferase [Pyrinomonadaceae bacterium]